MSHVVVIGAGLAGLSAACHLIGQGHRVTVLERESGPGGRGLRVEQDGFTFDHPDVQAVLAYSLRR